MAPQVKIADGAFALAASFAALSWVDIIAKGLAITASVIAIVAGLYAIRGHRRNLKK